jgi:ABC-type polysaccharide/polyol phosphate transport system ATPase subunit
MKNAIEFNHVNKNYKIIKNRATTLKEALINKILRKNQQEVVEHCVLNDASFSILKGDTIGIVGRNGAGKSTTLKLIAKIISPDSGKVIVNGSVSSLIEIGAGFQPDLSGKENVYLYGTILGLTKKYLDEHYDSIVEFSELAEFMNTPVKNYSSGMYMRLAFSVAIHVNPDILLIDEVLAVGDARFQSKCMNKLKEFQKKGKTIVFVSHDIVSVRELCHKAIYIDHGGTITFGETERIVNLYYAKLYASESSPSFNYDEQPIDFEPDGIIKQKNEHMVENESSIWGNRRITIKQAYFSDISGNITNIFQVNDDIVMNITLEANTLESDVVVGIAIYDEKYTHLSGPNSKIDGIVIEEIVGAKNVKFIMNKPLFLQGTYFMTLAIYDFSCTEPYMVMDKYFKFHILNERQEFGIIRTNIEWILD